MFLKETSCELEHCSLILLSAKIVCMIKLTID